MHYSSPSIMLLISFLGSGRGFPGNPNYFLLATVATCPDPGSPEKGFREDRLEEFIVGTEVEIGCEINTKLNGTSKRKCLPSGEWTGEQPTCVGKWKCCFNRIGEGLVGWKMTVVVIIRFMINGLSWQENGRENLQVSHSYSNVFFLDNSVQGKGTTKLFKTVMGKNPTQRSFGIRCAAEKTKYIDKGSTFKFLETVLFSIMVYSYSHVFFMRICDLTANQQPLCDSSFKKWNMKPGLHKPWT